jgi:thiamine biosynthesis lipoprotein
MSRAALLPLFLSLSVLPVACGSPEPIHLKGQAMGTFFTVDYVGDVEPAKVAGRIRTALDEWDQLFNTYREDSEISRFNANKSTKLIRMTPMFLLMVFEALEMADKTEGAFDPTIGPLLRLHGFGPGATKPEAPRTDAQIAAAMKLCGYKQIERLPGRGLRKRIPDVELDLNAIAKGAGVDRLAAVLESDLGIQHFMINIGGEVRCRGQHPEGRPWRLGVETPGSDTPAATVDLEDEAMATSGSYRQFHSLHGKKVHHILDPRTGRNAQTNVVSVSVVASSCSVADGLATALMVVGPEGCEKILKQYPGCGLRVLFLLRGKDGGLEQRGFGWR